MSNLDHRPWMNNSQRAQSGFANFKFYQRDTTLCMSHLDHRSWIKSSTAGVVLVLEYLINIISLAPSVASASPAFHKHSQRHAPTSMSSVVPSCSQHSHQRSSHPHPPTCPLFPPALPPFHPPFPARLTPFLFSHLRQPNYVCKCLVNLPRYKFE